jgi:plastocyanin
MTIITVLILLVSYYTTTSYGTTNSAAATISIPVGASTPGNPAYEPSSLTVKKSDKIDVINEDSFPHTVTNGKGPDDPEAGRQFDTSIIRPGTPDEPKSVELVTANLEAGEYDFHCAVHPFMTGKLNIVE